LLPRTLIAAADICLWRLQLNLTLRRLYHPLVNRLPETLFWTRVMQDARANTRPKRRDAEKRTLTFGWLKSSRGRESGAFFGRCRHLE
jgi:hypothetical protein